MACRFFVYGKKYIQKAIAVSHYFAQDSYCLIIYKLFSFYETSVCSAYSSNDQSHRVCAHGTKPRFIQSGFRMLSL